MTFILSITKINIVAIPIPSATHANRSVHPLTVPLGTNGSWNSSNTA